MPKLATPDDPNFETSMPPDGLSPIATAVLVRWTEIETALRVLPEAPSPDQLFDAASLASMLMVSPRTLENWRAVDRGPKVTHVGSAVRYRYRDVLEWIAAQNP